MKVKYILISFILFYGSSGFGQEVIKFSSGFVNPPIIKPDGNLIIKARSNSFGAIEDKVFEFDTKDLTHEYCRLESPYNRILFPNDSLVLEIDQMFGTWNNFTYYAMDSCTSYKGGSSLSIPLDDKISIATESGKMYGIDPTTNEFIHLDELGEIIKKSPILGAQFTKPKAFGSDKGYLFILDNNQRIYKIDTSGNVFSNVNFEYNSSASIVQIGFDFFTLKNLSGRYFTTHIDTSGKELLSIQLHIDCNSCEFTGVVHSENDGIYLLGKKIIHEDHFDADGNRIPADSDAIISKFDRNGNFISSKIFDGKYEDEFISGAIIEDRGMIILGEFDFIYLNGNDFPKAGYVLFDFDLSDSKDLVSDIEKKEVTINPNPANESFQVYSEDFINGSFDVTIFNLAGDLVLRKNEVKLPKTIDTSQCEPGIYFLQLREKEGNSRPIYKKLIIAH